MSETQRVHPSISQRLVVVALFVAIGLLTVAVFSPWVPLVTGAKALAGRIGVTFALLIAALLARRSATWNFCWQVLYGLFVLMAASSADWYFGNGLIRMKVVNPAVPKGMAFQKLADCFVISTVVLVATRMSGSSLRSVYVQKGNLRQGIVVGLLTFAASAAVAIPLAQFMFRAEDLTATQILQWSPWILLFVLTSATDEEIMFRGLFLRKLEPFGGKFLANFLIALVFTGLHAVVTYTNDQMGFLAATFPLALAWGYVMQKTDAIWGSILFHAGMDIPIILGMFSVAS